MNLFDIKVSFRGKVWSLAVGRDTALPPPPPRLDKKAYRVRIIQIGPNKILAIKTVRDHLNNGLLEAKTWVESAFPTVDFKTSHEAASFRQDMQASGATVMEIQEVTTGEMPVGDQVINILEEESSDNCDRCLKARALIAASRLTTETTE